MTESPSPQYVYTAVDSRGEQYFGMADLEYIQAKVDQLYGMVRDEKGNIPSGYKMRIAKLEIKFVEWVDHD